MEHSDTGNQEGRPQLPQHHPQQQQQLQQQQQQQEQHPGISRQPAVPWSTQQQQQQQLYLQQQQEQAAAAYISGRHPYAPSSSQQADIMAAAQPLLDPQNEYLQQQYLQQQQQQQRQYAATWGAANSRGGNPSLAIGGYPPLQQQHHQQQQHPYAQQLSYQEQLAMQQSIMASSTPGGAPHPLLVQHPLHHHHPGQALQPAHPNMDHSLLAAAAGMHMPPGMVAGLPPPYLQPRVGRLPADRPLIKLSLSLIDTYKHINTIYYEERDARRAARASNKEKVGSSSTTATGLPRQGKKNALTGGQATTVGSGGGGPSAHAKRQHSSSQSQGGGGGTSISTSGPGGPHNNGWDDDNYDYIITSGELFYQNRYRLQERIGKGSFGQVVRAVDVERNVDVAIKIIKSKKPFLMQAKTEIELLTHLNERDADDQHNVVRLITHFMYRNHQCLVFEMLSLNLYELLKNTQFGGVSLNLIRKFAKQVLKALAFLARKDVDIIHCDLKPENILLRHPKKSGVKVIDFGSSCRSNKRMYSYIQSRFYRSPEVMLGLPYSTAIDIWSLGCILAEMHTGEPLFSGSDQFDQMQKIVKLLGMVPDHMLDQATDQHRLQFFERVMTPSGRVGWWIKQQKTITSSRSGSSSQQQPVPPSQQSPDAKGGLVLPSQDPLSSLMQVIRAETHRKKKYPPSETGNSPQNYEFFVDLIYRMLTYDPRDRIKPEDAMNHPFLTSSG